jgi:hypothetical protein
MQLVTHATTKVPVEACPPCDDCRLPAAFRAEVADVPRGRLVRVFQCQNCAKIIWQDDAGKREMTRAYRKCPALQITGRYCERARTIGKGHLQPRSPTWCSIPTTAETERPHTVDATVRAARSGRPGTSPRPPAVPGSGRSMTLEMKMRRLLAALFSTAISMTQMSVFRARIDNTELSHALSAAASHVKPR